jgi:PAS domain S-box-containing protein
MTSIPENPPTQDSANKITEEYRILHKVAQILQTTGELKGMLQDVLRAITGFEELKVENKAGLFLADEDNKVLRLFTTFGKFSKEFLENEKEVPFGNCLCGRVAESGQILMSESCFTDSRHERRYDDMTAHGHYIVPLKTSEKLVGVMFLYTNTNPVWYQHSQEVLLSIGGLIANTIERKRIDEELKLFKNHLEYQVKQRTSELRESQRTLETLISNLPGMMYRSLNDKAWTMEYVSDGCESLTGYSASDLMNQKISYNEIIHPEDRAAVWDAVQEALRECRAFKMNYRIQDLFGNEKMVWEQGRGVYSDSGELLALEGFITNITDRHKMEEELKSSHEKLRNLSNRLQSIREKEKSRIARQVHDELGQSLTALKMDISHLERNLPSNPANMLEQIQSMTKIIDNTIQSVQRIAMELRPPILDAFGLCEAIAWQAGEYNKKLGIQFDLNCLQEQVDLEKDLETTLFRIFQETLTNIVRHAEAGRVQVGLNRVNEQLVFEIEDNGKGIKKEHIENPNSLGLIGIQERVHSWNGQIQFEGSPEKGTKVTVKIPLMQK